MSAVTADPIVRASARWFWWIAGLSLVNSVLAVSGADLSFVVGLGITALADAVFAKALPLAVLANVVAIAFYLAIGFFAEREKLWAFYVGLAVYVLDAAIYVLFQDWMSVAFHAFVIYVVFKGAMRLRSLPKGTVATTPAPTQPSS